MSNRIVLKLVPKSVFSDLSSFLHQRNCDLSRSCIVPIVLIREIITGLNIERTARCNLTTSRTDLDLSI